ncbi:MAG: nitronate monooxygenase [Candidatus Omnitrophica bacterium]|nr:nitronate monooxygenase [Candidatus Omnitrophota bacterium]
MNKNSLPDLRIGNIVINPPIVQGGMGVRISKSSLASAVSNTGALGVIATVGLGDEKESEEDYEKSSRGALSAEIREAKKKTSGYLGVNIMYALSNFNSLVKTSVDENIDVIFSGAGLPLNLPSLVANTNIKIVPIVSSSRALNILCRVWGKRYNRLPDAVVLEGPMAGGHLGFSLSELENKENCLEELFYKVKDEINMIEKEANQKVPMIVAGGIFTGKDIAKFLSMGADGVQIATRFICTHECDASEAYKKEIIKSKKEDIIVIKSPVGLPGRVIKNQFVEKILSGKKVRFKCPYKCLRSCDPDTVNYCIADALTNASRGNFKKGFAMCGENAYLVDKIVSVQELTDELVSEALKELHIRTR